MTKNAYFFIHHGDSSKQVLVVVYTKYELIPSIIRCHTCIQGIWPQNPVFETLTLGQPSRHPENKITMILVQIFLFYKGFP